MKKLLLLICYCITLGAFAQFPGEDVYLFDNAMVKPKEISESLQKYAYDNFYSELKEGSYDINILKKVRGKTTKSSYDLLVGKPFKVEAYHKIENKYGDYYTLILTNNELGTLYYQYKPEYESSFELDFVEIPNLPTDFYCKYIEERINSHGGITYSTDIKNGISISRIDTKSDGTVYTVFMRQIGETPEVGKKGCYLILDDGSKIEKTDCEVDVEVSEYGEYLYTTIAILTKDEIQKISEHPIVENAVYIFKDTVKDGVRISKMVSCLLNK